MKLKTSFFNRALFLKNITRFWPVWTLYLVVLFFSMPFNLYLNVRRVSGVHAEVEKAGRLFDCIQMNLEPVVVFLFAILCALAVFSYLYSARNCNMIHAFPVKRDELFRTGYASGLLFLIVPQIVMFLLTLLVCIFNGVPSVEYLFYWLLYVMGMSFLFYSIAVFFCMLTGNHFAAVVYYGLGNLIYVIIKALILSLVEMLGYGFTYNWNWSQRDLVLSPLAFLSGRVDFSWNIDEEYNITDIVMSGGRPIAFYLIAAAALVAFSVLLYKKRQLECAGDILSLNWMKPVFRWLAAFGAGTGFALLFVAVFFYNSPAGHVVLKVCSIGFSFVFFFAAEMLIRKKFRVFAKKRILEWVVCGAAVFVLLTAISADWFGAERYVPEPEEVYAVNLREDYLETEMSEPEGIAKICDIHQTILDNRAENAGAADAPTVYVGLEYFLKNGRRIVRNYEIPVDHTYLEDPDSAAGKISALEQNPDNYLFSLFGVDSRNVRILRGKYFQGDEFDSYEELTKEQAAALFAAVKEDIGEGNYLYGLRSILTDADNSYYNSLTFEGSIRYNELPVEVRDQIDSEDYWTVMANGDREHILYQTFGIYKSCTHTIQALIDLGIIADESELVTEAEYSSSTQG